jgi:hypothetical protein
VLLYLRLLLLWSSEVESLPILWAGIIAPKNCPAICLAYTTVRVREKPMHQPSVNPCVHKLISPEGWKTKGIQSWGSWLFLFTKEASRAYVSVFWATSPKVPESTSGNCQFPALCSLWKVLGSGKAQLLPLPQRSPEDQLS